jgi:hypothetical protein
VHRHPTQHPGSRQGHRGKQSHQSLPKNAQTFGTSLPEPSSLQRTRSSWPHQVVPWSRWGASSRRHSCGILQSPQAPHVKRVSCAK